MYEENRTGFILKDILLQVFLVIIFVFILVWLFPTKSYVDKKIDSSLDPIYQEFFNEHLESMKEAAQSYFTTSRLPKKVGDKVTITLGDMLDKKLITSFVDSNQKQCSLTGSYVEVTKMDGEYTMKVNLSCSDKSDYILVNMGCYNYCDSALCEKQQSTSTSTSTNTNNNNTNNNSTQTTNKTYQYEYKLVTAGSYTDWSSWSKWSETKVTANNYKDVETKKVWEVVDTEKVLVDTETTYEKAEKVTDKKTYGVETSITCPTGYKKYNSNSSTTKICIADPIKSTSTTKYIDALTKTTYSCSNGTTPVNGKCTVTTTKQESTSAASSVVYGDWVYVGRQTFNGSKTTTDTMQYVYVSQSQELDCNNNCSVVVKVTYDVYKRSNSTKYSCPSGYTLSGTKCVKNVSTTSTVDATKTTTQYCENGTNPSNGKCLVSSTTSSTQKTCPGNGTYDATMGWCYVRGTSTTVCENGIDGKVSSNKCIVETTKYVCDEGKLVGKQCKITENVYETKKIYGYVTYYRYRTREYINGSTKTAWSSSQKDKDLLNKGYVLTGKKQEITKA